MGGWMCLILCINREPTSGSVVDHYHQLILFNAAHQITTPLPVISTGMVLLMPSTVRVRKCLRNVVILPNK
jgi:hypothetical protein